jgi:heme oxygenase
MYGFYAPLEEIFASDTVLEGVVARPMAPQLLRELRALGEHAPPVWCTNLPETSTLARRLGIAYVLYRTTWKRFAVLADRLLLTRAAEDDAMLAAHETMAKLSDWLGAARRACRGSASRPSSPGTPAAAR